MRTYTVVIDEDVPLADKKPGEQSRYQHPLSYLLGNLNVGDSFIYPASTCEGFNGLRSIASSTGRRGGKKFATRLVTDGEGVDRLRFWRTA
jgi:hypothetical protein